MGNKNDIIRLIRKYRTGTATEEEVWELLWHIRSGEHTDLIETAISEGLLDEVPAGADQSPYLQAKFDALYQQIDRQRKAGRSLVPVRRRLSHWLPYAAAAVFVCMIGMWLYRGITRQPPAAVTRQADIGPGGNRATLTLADGRTLELDSTQTGIIISDRDIRYKDGDMIQDQNRSNVLRSGQADVLLQLSTPKGGAYHVILPDGTKVWLNAASALKYPARFTGNTRTVEISGEGFFEIKEDQHRPFKVISRGQEIVVLGTAFNVVAYPDEASARTTLVSGAIQVSTVHLSGQPVVAERLLPSQQAVVEGSNLTVNTVDVASETAWRNGLITFTGKSFAAIMREISRWYDIEIVYEKSIPEIALYGGLNRGDNFSVVLKLLQVSEVPCRLEGRRLTIE